MVSFKKKFLSLFCVCAVSVLVGATNMFAAIADPGGPYYGRVGTAVDMVGLASCNPENIISFFN